MVQINLIDPAVKPTIKKNEFRHSWHRIDDKTC